MLAASAPLDMFDPRNGPPYPAEFLARYRAAQVDRSDRITGRAKDRLTELAGRGLADMPFLVHGVAADPRFLDLSLDPSDRAAGTLWGDAWTANFQPATLGHYTTLRSWLSQWSRRCSRGDGPATLRDVTVPALVIYGTADQGCFPSHARALYEAATHPGKELVALEGGRHYLNGQPELTRRMAGTVRHWLDAVLG